MFKELEDFMKRREINFKILVEETKRQHVVMSLASVRRECA